MTTRVFCGGLTKTECTQKLKKIKASHGLITGNDKEFVLDFWRATQGSELVHQLSPSDDCDVVVEPTASGQYVGLYAVQPNGHKVSIVTYPLSVHTFLVRQALRQAVMEQTQHFRQLRQSEPGYVCAKCNQDLHDTPVTPHVDHVQPTFAQLKKQFFALEKRSERHLKYKTVDNRIINLADEELQARWVKFHMQHAHLRMLCAPCNMVWWELEDTTCMIVLDE